MKKEELLQQQHDVVYVDYFFLAEHQLNAVVHMLKENEIPYQLKIPSYTQDTLIVPTSTEVALQRNSHVVRIPEAYHSKVHYILPEYPNLNEDSKLVRALFLSTTCDNQQLMDILIYPKEWNAGDATIARELLYHRGLHITDKLLAERKTVSSAERSAAKKKNQIKQVVLFVLVLILIAALLLLDNIV